MNDSGVRSVYLPRGEWVDLWSGEQFAGPRWLRDVASPPDQIPVFVRKSARIPLYPDPVRSTDEMNLDRTIDLVIDNTFTGLARSALGSSLGWR